MRLYRVFSGKRYKFVSDHKAKSVAQEKAKSVRKSGDSARITKTKHGYDVWRCVD